jgi:hypothetical protein
MAPGRNNSIRRTDLWHCTSILRRLSPISLLVLLAATACGRLHFDATNTNDADPFGIDATDGASGDSSVMPAILTGCEAYFKMDEDSWAGGVIDSCKSNVGSAGGGAVRVDDSPGRVGELVGNSSCIQIPDTLSLRGGAALTISAWVKRHSPRQRRSLSVA